MCFKPLLLLPASNSDFSLLTPQTKTPVHGSLRTVQVFLGLCCDFVRVDIYIWLSFRAEYAQLFATLIARTAKDVDVLIDSLPSEESTSALQVIRGGDAFNHWLCWDSCLFKMMICPRWSLGCTSAFRSAGGAVWPGPSGCFTRIWDLWSITDRPIGFIDAKTGLFLFKSNND